MRSSRVLAILTAAAIAGLLVTSVAGCVDDGGPVEVVALPSRPLEQPAANLPGRLHQRNKLGPLGQGSCVHASMVMLFRWMNQPDVADAWWRTYGDGEYSDRLMRRLDAAGIQYAATERADPRFLDWCVESQRGAIIWWKPSHCCFFAGWVWQDGRQYAAIIDNNAPGRFELTPRDQFIRLWAGYGGFGLTILSDPPGALTYPSYRVIQ